MVARATCEKEKYRPSKKRNATPMHCRRVSVLIERLSVDPLRGEIGNGSKVMRSPNRVARIRNLCLAICYDKGSLFLNHVYV